MEQLDVVVVGAGVVGLAVARALALDGRSVWVLEREAGIGMGVSSRSSEVIHAGLYYPEGSHKARLCVAGKALLYSYLAQRGLPHRRCGKLLVAGAAERDSLALWQAKAAANGVHDLQPLSRAEALALEPALDCAGALWSPSTGIVDSHALMLSLQGDLERAGGQVVTRCGVEHLAPAPGGGMHLRCADGTELWARAVVNAAGLQAPALARASGALAEGLVPPTFFAKGRYFSLTGRSPFRHLIYPLPGPGLAGLGVHLTLDLAGQARFGPDVVWVDSDHDFSVDPAAAAAFESAIRGYWPGLPVAALQPSYAGIRPKLSGPGQPAADFVLQGPAEHGVPGWLNLFGIESPGLTSCLALGEWARTALAD